MPDPSQFVRPFFSGSENANLYAFAALRGDGSVVAWGGSNSGGDLGTKAPDLASGVTTVFSNSNAFAALKADGSVVTWGSFLFGGDSSAVAAALSGGVASVASSQGAFAALKTDGSVVTWGFGTAGGDSSAVAADLAAGVVKIASNENAFAALKDDGSVVTWGFGDGGGDSSAAAASLTGGVASLASTGNAFAALKSDGSVVTWGNSFSGGAIPPGISADLAAGVARLFGAPDTFVALKDDGSLFTWGFSGIGPQLSGVANVFSTGQDFAALMTDGSVVTWGTNIGGSPFTPSGATSGVLRVYATNYAFAAVKSDGTVVTWGSASGGGDSSAVAAQLTGVVVVFASGNAFAALKQDGTVVTWGDATRGGDSSAVSAQLTGVTDMIANAYGFAALRNDGAVVSWGNASYGGDSSTVSAQLVDVVGFSSVVDVVCYLAGTRILTDRGEVAVEDLRPGDRVAARFGGLRAVRWIGEQRYAGRFAGSRLAPVRIAAGALGEGQPRRDLRVSPGHAVLVDGTLVLAALLVDGARIVQEPPPETIAYFHIDLGAHDCVLAEGAWAESYAEHLNRNSFHNAAAFHAAHPDREPCVQPTCLPVVKDPADPRLPALRAALALTAAPGAAPAAVLHLMVDGRRLDPAEIAPEVWRFAIPAGSHQVMLCAPTMPARPLGGAHDPRRLGLCLRRITVSAGGTARDIALDHPSLHQGLHAPEHGPHGAWRWTGGNVPLAAALLGCDAAAVTLDLHATPAAAMARAVAA